VAVELTRLRNYVHLSYCRPIPFSTLTSRSTTARVDTVDEEPPASTGLNQQPGG